jgi:CheY-like chemotaxis protein
MSEILAPATGSDKDKEMAGSKTADAKPTDSKKGPPPTIGVRVLLVSGDIQTIDTLCESMGKMSMHVDICSDFASAAYKLCHSKFEALVVDFKDRPEALDLLKKLRQMTSHKSSVVLAVLNCDEEMPSAFRAGASFVLVKPLSAAVLMRTLRVSYPLMVNEKRRSFRCPVRVPVYVTIGSQPEFMATSANISEVGIALTNSPGLQVGDRVTLRLMLPHTKADAKIVAEVCWRNPAGYSGMEFVQVPAAVKEQLVSWLAARLEDYLREESAALRG